jgi:ketosteroid isomerase-like protein
MLSSRLSLEPRQSSTMRTFFLLGATVGCVAVVACAPARPATEAVNAEAANAGIDALNARLIDAYRHRDPAEYAALYTDAAVFEWPAFNSVHGPAALAAMARDNWAGQRDVDLRLHVVTRRLASDHATEFGAFEQSWSDSAGVRRTEFGRYASLLVRQADGSWRMDRFFGFEDSTRTASPPR